MKKAVGLVDQNVVIKTCKIQKRNSVVERKLIIFKFFKQ